MAGASPVCPSPQRGYECDIPVLDEVPTLESILSQVRGGEGRGGEGRGEGGGREGRGERRGRRRGEGGEGRGEARVKSEL